jgi:Na+/glutamate symporter
MDPVGGGAGVTLAPASATCGLVAGGRSGGQVSVLSHGKRKRSKNDHATRLAWMSKVV